MRSKLDQIYRSILLTKFFSQGWGKPENLREIFAFRKILSDREACMNLVDENYPIAITKEVEHRDHFIIEAEFTSPLVHYLPKMLPKESEKAYFQMILPKKWSTDLKPTCLHLAGTGDHGFWRRRMLMGKPLAQESGIASIIHENPFYGQRKPPNQLRSSLRNVSDLFLMGGCLILESIAIFHWAEKQGLGPLGITGISMGGHMASLAACIWPKPIPLIPCLSWSTASGVFTQGVLSGAINWEMLKNQYFSDKVFRDELFDMIQSPEGHFCLYHEFGQHFARDFPENIQDLGNLEENNSFSDHLAATKEKKKQTSVLQRLNIFESLSSFTKRRSEGNGYKFPFRSEGDKLHPVLIRPSTSVDTQPVIFEPYIKVRDSLTWEAVQFMRGIMDECTHLGNFPMPIDPSLIIIVSAEKDAYMPKDGIIPLTKIWPGSEQRTMINQGHIAAFLFRQQMFRKAITDSFERYAQKYSSGPTCSSNNKLNHPIYQDKTNMKISVS